MKNLKRSIALVLVLCMLCSFLPAGALAAGNDAPVITGTSNAPFEKGTGGSNSFRIPALVTLSDGTLVAAADARWNTTWDGGGLDTMVAISKDNGATWTHSFANYLGDNGDEYNGASSCFIDPALAVMTKDENNDGVNEDTVYMLVDLYPYGIALNGSGNTAPNTDTGFNDAGYLKLSNDGHASFGYYLKDGKIYPNDSDTAVAGYEVDRHFNVTKDGTYHSNLFFSDCDYKVARTGYLYLTSSTNGGETWSEPQLLNLKNVGEQVCLVGPGRGAVVYNGETPYIVFPIYSYTSGVQRVGFLYSADGVNWQRSENLNYNWGSESAVVDLNNDSMRIFFRNGNGQLMYVDYSWANGWGTPKGTGVSTNSNTQLSAISLQQSIDGQDVILVSCPIGPSGNGISSSAYTDRVNGRIFLFTVDEETKAMTKQGEVAVDSKHSTNPNYFLYSCLSALTDEYGNETGEIAILYEDYSQSTTNGSGDNFYCEMSFDVVNIADFSVTPDDSGDTDVDQDGSDGESYDGNVIVKVGQTFTETIDNIYVASGSIERDEATVSWVGTEGDNASTAVTIVGKAVGNTTVEIGNAISYDIAVVPESVTDVVDVPLTVGGTNTYTIEGYALNGSYDDTTVATVNWVGSAEGDGITKLTAATMPTSVGSSIECVIGDGQGNYMALNNGTLVNVTDVNQATKWTVTYIGDNNSMPQYKILSDGYYIRLDSNTLAAGISNSSNAHYYTAGQGFFCSSNGSNVWIYNNGWTVGSGGANAAKAYTVETIPYTTVTITGNTVGTTEVEVGGTRYNITVKDAMDVQLKVGETFTEKVENVYVPSGITETDVATVTWVGTEASSSYATANLGTDSSYNGDTIDVAKCLYTFTASDNGFVVQSKSNPSLYLNTTKNASGCPNASVSNTVLVNTGNGTNTFYLHCVPKSGDNTTGYGYLYFWHDGKNRFDRNTGTSGAEAQCSFYLYRPATAEEQGSSEIPGYVRVTDAYNAIADGDYLIAHEYNGAYYLLHPATTTTGDDAGRYPHVAKVTGLTDGTDTEASTVVTITAKKVGQTTVNIGNGAIAYDVIVNPADSAAPVNVQLKVNETTTITDESGAYTSATPEPDSNVVKMELMPNVGETETVIGEAVSTITPGKYVIYTYLGAYVTNDADGNYIDLSATEQTVWNVAVADSAAGTYYITDSEGNYLTVGSGTAGVTSTQTAVKLVYGTSGDDQNQSGFFIKDANGSYNLNNSGATDNAYGKSGAEGSWSRWQFKPYSETVKDSTEITFTGVTPGNTTAVVGGTTYNITVTLPEGMSVVDVELEVDETSEVFTDNTGNYENNITREPDASIATIDVNSVAGEAEYTVSTDKATALEADATYIIRVTGTNYALTTNKGGTTWSDSDGDSRAFENYTGPEADNMWTLEASGNGYKLKSAAGYLNLGKNAAYMTATGGDTFTLTNDNGVWAIGDGSYNIDALGGLTSYYCAGGWPNSGTRFDLYKVTEVTPYSSEITFTGVSEGKTSAIVGNTLYRINVIPAGTVKVNLQVSESKEYVNNTGSIQPGYDSSVALVSIIKKPIPVDTIESGKKYLIVNKSTGEVLTDTEIQVSGTWGDKDGLKTSGQVSGDSTELWTITATGDGTYTVVQDGNYLAIAGYVAYAGTTYQPNLILTHTDNGWTIADRETRTQLDGHNDDAYYLSDNVGNNYSGGALGTSSTSNDAMYWDIYEIERGVKITGLSVGDTIATVGDIEYSIKVTMGYAELNVYPGMSTTKPVTGTVTDDDIADFNAAYGDKVTVARKGNNLVFTGVADGNVTAVLGATEYTINVPAAEVRDIILYEGVVTRDIIDGALYDNFDAVQPDNTKAYIHGVTNDGTETAVVFTGVAAGTTEAQVGHVKYNITVKSLASGGDIEDFTSIVGEGTYTAGSSTLDLDDKVIKSLRITEGASFDVGVDVTDYETIDWSSDDESIAEVDDDGNITAVKAGTTMVTATVTKGGVTESISVSVTVVPSLLGDNYTGETSFIFNYIDEVYNTDPYYTLFLSSESTTDAVDNHEMIMVAEGEVIWFERPASAVAAIVWTADPWDNHALTYMASTGSAGEYFPLQTEDHVLGTGTVNGVKYYKGNNAYNNILDYMKNAGGDWTDALDSMLEESIHVGENYWEDPGCDGAMSFSRYENDTNPNLVSALTFVSDALPEVDKRVYGVLGASAHINEWELYQDGMYATVGEYVYFAITVTQEAPHSWQLNTDGSIVTDDAGNKLAALEYPSSVDLTDRLMHPIVDEDGNVTYEPTPMLANPPYFYSKELDRLDEDHNESEADDDDGYILNPDLQSNTKDVADVLNAGWTQDQINDGQRVHEFYVVYKIQENDNNSLLVNGVNMEFEFSSAYSSGSHTKNATAKASMYILGQSLGDVVVDFGLPVTISGLTSAHLADRFNEDNTNNAIDGAEYGEVDIVANDDGTYSVTYTPDRIIQDYDVVYLMDDYGNLVNYFRVYPATTVFYEETFLKPAESASDESGETQASDGPAWTQVGTPVADPQEKETLSEERIHPYGYDDVYDSAAHQNGASNSYLYADTIGAITSFEFTGTGFDLYANCDDQSGYVGVIVKNSAGEYVKMFTVDTVVKAGTTPSTAGPAGSTALSTIQSSMPIVAVDLGAYDTYTVTVSKIMENEHVKLDGIRIYNTMEDSTIFETHLEDNPEFYELRDYVLKAVNVDTIGSAMYGDDWMDKFKEDGTTANNLIGALAGQVYGDISTDDERPTAVVTGIEDSDVQDLLDNGPKNELFLFPGQTLSFNVQTNRAIQIGLKAPAGATKYTLSYTVNGNTNPVADNKPLTTSVDMFYELENETGTMNTYLVSITNDGDKILSVTDLKICDDPNAAFVSLTEEDIEQILLNAIGVEEDPEEQMPFVDVPEDSFYYDSVLWAVTNGVTEGVTEDHFAPAVACNRAQVVTMLWRAAGSPEPTVTGHSFEDIEAGSFYEQAVLWAVEKGITKGTDETHFSPDLECNRATVVTMLYRASEDQTVVNAENPFSDVSADEWYTTAILWAVERDITNGIGDGLFGVENICNRAQIVTFLYRAQN